MSNKRKWAKPDPWVVPQPKMPRNSFTHLMLAFKCDNCQGTGTIRNPRPTECDACHGDGLSDRVDDITDDPHWLGGVAGWENLTDKEAYKLGIFWAISNDDALVELLAAFHVELIEHDAIWAGDILDPSA